MVTPCIWLGTTHPCNPPQYGLWENLHFFMICMYKHCFLPVLLVFVMKCCITMSEWLALCLITIITACCLHLLICTCLNEFFTHCLPIIICVLCWCLHPLLATFICVILCWRLLFFFYLIYTKISLVCFVFVTYFQSSRFCFWYRLSYTEKNVCIFCVASAAFLAFYLRLIDQIYIGTHVFISHQEVGIRI